MTLAMTFLMLKLTVLSFLAASVAGTGIAIDCITGYRYQGTDQVSSMQPGSACRPRRIRTRTNVEPHASQPHGEHERFDYSEGTEGRGGYCLRTQSVLEFSTMPNHPEAHHVSSQSVRVLFVK